MKLSEEYPDYFLSLPCQLGLQHVQELVHVHQVVGKSNVEVVLRKHMLEEDGSKILSKKKE